MPRGIDYGMMRRVLVESQQPESRRDFVNGMIGAIDAGELKVEDFDFRLLLESSVPGGREIVDSWNPRHGGGSGINLNSLMEAEATDTAAFANINGQLAYSTILAKYNSEKFVFKDLIPTVQTPFSGEKIPGIGGLGDKAEVVEEKGFFPLVGPNEDWVRTPETKKRGLRTAFTKEAFFFNRVGARLMEEGGAVGEWLGLNREKRAIDCIIDENTTSHRYNRKDRGAVATYGNNSGNHDWDNLEATNGLVDWTDINNALLLLSAIRDPNTGEPLDMGMGQYDLVCTKGLEATALMILRATEVVTHVGGYATSGNLTEMRGPNPVAGKFRVLCTNLVADRLATDTSWFIGNIGEAFVYMENWPLQVKQSPANSQREFDQDIVLEYRADERGAYSTKEPRKMVTCTA